MKITTNIKATSRLLVILCLAGAMQAIPCSALAATASKVNAVLAIQYENQFIATVLTQGPTPIMNVDLVVDGSVLQGFREERFVILPSQNLTLFKFTKSGQVVLTGSTITATNNGGDAQKTVICNPGRLLHQLVVCR